MTQILRFHAPGPWLTRNLKECVLASDYDDLAARLAEAERDAARYRWIHDHVEYVHGTGFVLELHPDADGPSRFQWGVDAAMKIAAQQITHNFGADDDGFCDSCGEPEDAAVHRHRTPDSATTRENAGL